MKVYRSRITGREYPASQYINHGHGGEYRGFKDLPADEYPFQVIEHDELIEHPHGFNIRVIYCDGNPKLTGEYTTEKILKDVIALYSNELHDELVEIKKIVSGSKDFLAAYTNTCINFVTNEMAAFCNTHEVKNPGKEKEMMPLPVIEYPIWFNNLEDLMCELTWGKKDRKILINEVLPRMLNTFVHYFDALALSDFSVVDSSVVDKIIEDVIIGFPDKVAAYKSGKLGLINMLFGEVMKASGGKIDMKEARSKLEAKLSEKIQC